MDNVFTCFNGIKYVFIIICMFTILHRAYGQCDAGTRPLTVNATSIPQYVTSPNYGNRYPAGSNCAWIISAPGTDEKVILNVEDATFDMGDSLTIYDGDSTSATQLVQGTGYFASNSLNEYVSTNSALYLRFISDANFNQDGFKALYFTADPASQQQCSENLTATLDLQYLMSANLPGVYNSYNCTTYITAQDQYYTISFRIYFLDVEESNDCANDKFEILQGNDASDATPLITECSTAKTYTFDDVDSVYSFASVTLASDNANNDYYGFFLGYFEVFQGINLTYPAENDTVHLTIDEDIPIGTVNTTVARIDVSTTGPDGLAFTLLQNGATSDLFDITADTTPDVYNLETVGLLDYENTTYYNLTIIMVDLTYPGLSATARFNVTLTDVDDEAPVFTNLPAIRTVYRYKKKGYKVFTVSSTDADITTEFQVVQYTIDRGDTEGLLHIDNETGEISLAINVVNFTSSITIYPITIVAYSVNSGEFSTATLKLFIPLDSPPECSHETAVASELNTNDAGAGTPIQFDDPWNCIDDNDYVIYSIGAVTPSLDTSLFEIDNGTGTITLLRSFDVTEVPSREFNVSVEATDSQAQTTTVYVLVGVSAMTCSPNPRKLYIRTDAELGSVIISDYNCTSSNTSSSMQYVIASQSPNGTFGVSGSSLTLLANVHKIRFYSLSLDISDGVDTFTIEFKVTVRFKQCTAMLNGSSMTSSHSAILIMAFVSALF